MIGIEQVKKMLCTNKKFLQSCTSLLNEKLLFKFDADMLSICRDMFMRLYFSIVSYIDENAVAYSLLSLQMLLPEAVMQNSIKSRRFTTRCIIHEQMFLRIFPFIFFSYIQTKFDYKHAFFSPSKWPISVRSSNSIGVSFRRKSVSLTGYFDDYFYGIVDADLKYKIDIIGQTGISFDNAVFLRLFSSLMCFPFMNMVKHKKKSRKV